MPFDILAKWLIILSNSLENMNNLVMLTYQNASDWLKLSCLDIAHKPIRESTLTIQNVLRVTHWSEIVGEQCA